MTNAIHFQRVTIHLKNGTNLGIDLQAEDPLSKMSWPIPNPKRKFLRSREFAALAGFASKK